MNKPSLVFLLLYPSQFEIAPFDKTISDEKIMDTAKKRYVLDERHVLKNAARAKAFFLDLDETLISFQGLLISKSKEKQTVDKVARDLFELKELEDVAVLCLGKEEFFPEQYFNKCRQAYRRYESLRCTTEVSPFRFSHPQFEKVLQEVNEWTNGFLSKGRKLLESISQKENSCFFIITTSHLSCAFAKLLLFGLAEYVPPSCLFHAIDMDKKAVFEALLKKWSLRPIDVFAIGDGENEREASRLLSIPFFHITCAGDLDSVCTAIRSYDNGQTSNEKRRKLLDATSS